MNITNQDIIDAELPLVGMVAKPLSEMTDEELRAHVVAIRNLRSSTQSLRAEMAKSKAIKAEAKETSKVSSLFEEF